MTASLKRNVIANGLGQGWRLVMNFAFVPVYVKYLGIEAYGLIGIFTLLQASLALLDMGLRPALGREMARFTAGAHDAQSIRNLLRSVELIGLALAAAITVLAWAGSPLVARSWLRVESLPLTTVTSAVRVMGVVIGLRFIEDIYVSCLSGLELQVQQNLIVVAMATVRGLGTVGVLALVSRTVEAFFIWQGVVSLMTVALFVGVVYQALPPAPWPARFSGAALRRIWHFAAGMMTITFLSLLLGSVDKVLLSRLLTLKAYGYYALAGVAVNGLTVLAGPVTAAFYPRFTALATLGNEPASRAAYHQGSQLVTVLIGSAAAMLIVFRHGIMLVWTGDPEITRQAGPLMAVLAVGTLLNAMISIPYQMMLAHGWTTLTIRVNIVAVCLLVPSVFWVAPRYGAIGTAWIWVALNSGYMIFIISLMHRRLMPEEKWIWYRQDVALPLATAAGVAVISHALIPDQPGRAGESIALALASGCVLAASAAMAPAVRRQISRYLPHTLNPIAQGSASAE